MMRTLLIFLILSVTFCCSVFAGTTEKDQNHDQIVALLDSSHSMISSDPWSAMELARKAQLLSNEYHDSLGLVNSGILLGIVNKNLGQFEQATNFYLDAYQIAELRHDTERMSVCLNNIGSVYQEMGSYSRALEYYKESLAIEEKAGNKSGISLRQYNIGAIYELLDSLDLAAAYYFNSLLAERELNNPDGIFYALYGIGGVNIRRQIFTEAEKNLQEAFILAEKEQDIKLQTLAANELGRLFQQWNKPEQSIDYYTKALLLADSTEQKSIIKSVYLNLSEIFESRGECVRSLDYLKKFVEINEEINNIAISTKIEELQTVFQVERKQKELELEKTANELKTSEVKRQKNLRNFLLICIVLFAVLMASNINRFRKKTKN
ncbi:MAG: tetratricopeptide repeat protein [Bacteroidetes bacterium]|nr:tetratricopeptide repeat protein [Bacteroidota bacterium]MBU1718321.1 tetratricopeptide repeat protein [Bacteroidota bacterium]